MGNEKSIKIDNHTGRLDAGEIEKLVKESEEMQEKDKEIKAKIDAKNTLESFTYNVKHAIEDKNEMKIRNKLSD